MNRALVIGDIEVPVVEQHAILARDVARPEKRPARGLETRDAPLVGGCADRPGSNGREAGDVGDALELGCAFRLRDGSFPTQDALVEVECEQPASGDTEETRPAGKDA